MLIIIISRSSLELDHVGSKTRLLGHQATQVSDLGPLWPSCLFINHNVFSSKYRYITLILHPEPGLQEFTHVLVMLISYQMVIFVFRKCSVTFLFQYS